MSREVGDTQEALSRFDRLRGEAGWSKAELDRQIEKNDASIRRLFTAVVNPELRTVAVMEAALAAEIQIVSRRSRQVRRVPASAA